MSIAVGDKVPDVEVKVMTADGPSTVRTGEILGTGKVVLFGVPGAFTPGCSKIHLPGFVQGAADLTAKGVDKIACIAVNDPWVMEAWAASQNVGDKIATLEELEREFNVARVTVRQAIELLQSEGLLKSHQGRGTFVTKTVEHDRWLQLATDWENYAQQMLEVLSSAHALFENLSPTGDWMPRPDERAPTRFEKRGARLGHGVWDLAFRRR